MVFSFQIIYFAQKNAGETLTTIEAEFVRSECHTHCLTGFCSLWTENQTNKTTTTKPLIPRHTYSKRPVLRGKGVQARYKPWCLDFSFFLVPTAEMRMLTSSIAVCLSFSPYLAVISEEEGDREGEEERSKKKKKRGGGEEGTVAVGGRDSRFLHSTPEIHQMHLAKEGKCSL